MADPRSPTPGNWTLDERAKRHLFGRACPHVTEGQTRSGFGCDRCTQDLIDSVWSAAVVAENTRCAKLICEGCKNNVELSGDYYHLYPGMVMFCKAAVFVRRTDAVS